MADDYKIATVMTKNYSNISDLERMLNQTAAEVPVILDFDETLFLRNSTEEYLNSIRPRLLGALALAGLQVLKPWRIFGGLNNEFLYRDLIRVTICTILFPWTLLIWKLKVKHLTKIFTNMPLINTLIKTGKKNIIISSSGFSFIIKPLLSTIDINYNTLSCCLLRNAGMKRRIGKLEVLKRHIGEEVIKNAILVTDSINDKTLLDAVGYSFLIKWPDAKYETALKNVYLPFVYLTYAKHPNGQYFFRRIVLDDIAILVLCMSIISPNIISSIISISIMMLAFWTIYELGYYQNDMVAENFEKKPQLEANYEKYRNYVKPGVAYAWAVFFTIIGSVAIHWNQMVLSFSTCQLLDLSILKICLIWLFFLFVVKLTFAFFNIISVDARVYIFPMLQIYKTFGFLLIGTTSMVGGAFMAAQVIQRWIPYIVYRSGGSRWEQRSHVQRFMLYLLISLGVMVGAQDFSHLKHYQFWTLFVWCLLRGAPDFVRASKVFKKVTFKKG